jgi:lysophospholipase L1-like esterase
MKVLKVIVVYVVILLLAEVAVRILAPEYRALDHRVGITGGVPFTLNSYGLRDYEFSMEKGREYRILCVGDSVTFGTQNRLEEIYPKVLEKLLNEGGKPQVRVINAGGLGGYPHLEFEYIKAKGLEFGLDHVILGLCLNDVGNTYVYSGSEQELIKAPDFWKNVSDFRSYSNPFSWDNKKPFAANIVTNIRVPLIKLRWYLRGRSYLFGFTDVTLTGLLYRFGLKKYSFDMYREKECMLSFGIDKTSEEGWKKLEASLIEMDRFLKERNIGFTVVVFPYEFQLSDKPRDNIFRIDKSKFTIDPQRRMLAFGKENNISVVDVLPAFQRSEKRLYYPEDYCHPNAYGHAIAARSIYDFLMRGGSAGINGE